jgi:hypothetical protein
MESVFGLVEVVLSALYRLEDELDRRDFLASEYDVAALERLVSRWEHDTIRKIHRESQRAGAA